MPIVRNVQVKVHPEITLNQDELFQPCGSRKPSCQFSEFLFFVFVDILGGEFYGPYRRPCGQYCPQVGRPGHSFHRVLHRPREPLSVSGRHLGPSPPKHD